MRVTGEAIGGPSERVGRLLRELDFEWGQFFLGGSAGLALRDIRDIGDLDVGVTTRYWTDLWLRGNWRIWTTDPDGPRRCDPPYLVREVQGIQVHVFNQWRLWSHDETEYNDFNRVFEDGIELVNGWPCIKLEILLRQKIDAVVNCMRDGEACRPKDLNDIRKIVTHVEDQQNRVTT
jgi:hypothetical protein